MAKLTPWFDCIDQPPKRSGWYELKMPGVRGITRFWWHSAGVWLCDRVDYFDVPWWIFYGAKWRGLASPPEGQR